jgi:hypothetical protein
MGSDDDMTLFKLEYFDSSTALPQAAFLLKKMILKSYGSRSERSPFQLGLGSPGLK